MCVLFWSLSSGGKGQAIGGKYSLILLNNRDVDFDRATSALCWRDGILACWDEQAEERGTWLGISKSGRVGVLLSITEPPQTLKQNSPSRGTLVRDLLSDPSPPFACLSAIAPKQEQFNGFQLLAIDKSRLATNYLILGLLPMPCNCQPIQPPPPFDVPPPPDPSLVFHLLSDDPPEAFEKLHTRHSDRFSPFARFLFDHSLCTLEETPEEGRHGSRT
uniref:Glutamine amidotransferase type-2 domain-containing protein n=1 Tax=Globodera pallida TaxID=36090 RepID=A0A183BTJ8_GLOPA